MSNVSDIFLNKLIKSPKRFLVLSFVILVGLTPFAKQLKTDFSHRAWFKEGHPVFVTLDTFEKEFGNDETAVIALHSKQDILNKKTIESIQRLTQKLEFIQEMYSVDSLRNANIIQSKEDDINIENLFPEEEPLSLESLKAKKELIQNDITLINRIITPDFKTTLIIGNLKPSFGKKVKYVDLKKRIMELIYQEEKLNPNLDYHLLGRVSVNAALREVAFADTKTLLPMLFLLILLFLFFFFKNLQGVLLPFLVTLFTIMATMGFAGFIHMKMVNISFVIPVVLVAISIADSIHIVDIFQKARLQYNKTEALYFSIRKNLFPTILTSLTTAVGFFSLAISEMEPIKLFGIVSGVGVVLAWFFSFFFLVPAIVLMKDVPPKHEKRRFHHLPQQYFNFINRYKFLILTSFIVVTSILIYNASHLKVDANPYRNFKPNHPLRKSNELMLKSFGGTTGPELVIDSGKKDGVKDPQFLTKVEKLTQYLLKQKVINNVTTPLDIIKKTNQSFHAEKKQYYRIPHDPEAFSQLVLLYNISVPSEKSLHHFITTDFRKIRLTLLWTLQNSISGLEKSKEIQDYAHKIGLNLQVTGKVNAKQMMVNFVITTFLKSIGLSFVFIFIILALYFRSFSLGLLAMIPNITPLAFASGILVLIGHSVDFTVSVVSSICLGIAVDDTIHFMANYIKARKAGLSISNSLIDIFEKTASSLILTTIVLMAGFGIFTLSDFIPNRNFGLLSASVLFVALICDILLLPVILIYVEQIFHRNTKNDLML